MGARNPLRADRLDGWSAMARARWTLVEAFELDGTQYVFAVRDTGDAVRSLTGREREVLDARLAGHSNKAAAHALGLSASTVRVLLARGLRKLGVRSLGELAK